jgi:prepilin peptidase CpaA
MAKAVQTQGSTPMFAIAPAALLATLTELMSALAVLLLLLAAAQDIQARLIPNWVSLALGLAGLSLRVASGELGLGLGVALAVFAVAFLAWRIGLMGGADVKLLAAAALLVPPSEVPALVLLIALWGGVLAILYLTLRPLLRLARSQVARPAGRLRRVLRAEAWRIRRGGPLPYAVAIAAGATQAILLQVLPV